MSSGGGDFEYEETQKTNKQKKQIAEEIKNKYSKKN